MIKYVPLHVHSFFSFDSITKPKELAKILTKYRLPACAMTDHGTISGTIQHIHAIEEQNKDNIDKGIDIAPIKALVGCELYICEKDSNIQTPDNMNLSHLPVIAKNDIGWNNLIKLTSKANEPTRFYKRPRLSLEELAEFSNGLISFSGHLGSTLADTILEGDLLKNDWHTAAIQNIKKHKEIFEDFYIEIQMMDAKNNPRAKILADILRDLAKETNTPCVATPDSHYLTKADVEDERVFICNMLNKTMKEAKDSGSLGGFFNSDNLHIPTHEEMSQWHTEAELKNTNEIANSVNYSKILSTPKLPRFDCPRGLNANEYLKELCREGWKKKIQHKIPKERHQEYIDRIKHELSVIEPVGLAGYFLIVQDIVQYSNNNGWLIGPGRGSGASCLISYLTNITKIDPIKYNLMFERFYNAGRNTETRIALPDIDTDFPTDVRGRVIDYIKDKYGYNKVSQIITFQTLKAKNAIKSVFRAYGEHSFDEINEMTRHIEDESKISGELEEIRQRGEDTSVIRWSLENKAKYFKDWCEIKEDGSISGPLANRFSQAMRLEGTKTSTSKHPSGIAIAPSALSELCPMIYDTKTKTQIAGFEMNDLESIGLVKLDILGLRMLDKMVGVKNTLLGHSNLSEEDIDEGTED